MSKQKKKGLVPELRFPEFRAEGEWEKSPLAKFIQSLDAGVSVNSGDRPAKITEFGVLKTSAVADGFFECSENKVVLADREIKRLKEPVSANTIIISRMNTPALVGANAYIKSSLKNIFLPDRLWAAKPKPKTEMRFIASILASNKGRNGLSELAKGTSGSMKNITKPDVLGLEITAPLLPEQKKIADFLSSIDELISVQNQKLEALRTHKKGLMQQLFPVEGEAVPKLRFPEFKGTWCLESLGDKTNKVGSGITPRGGDKNYKTTGRPFVRSQNIGWGYLILKNVAYIDENVHESFSATEIKKDDVLLNITGASIGRSAIADKAIIGGNVNQHVCIIRVKPEKLTSYFLNQFILSSNGQKQIDSFQAGGNREGLNFVQIRSFLIPLPPQIEEQKKIADCLLSIDEVIAVQNETIEALTSHKKGLMQQLFPIISDIK